MKIRIIRANTTCAGIFAFQESLIDISYSAIRDYIDELRMQAYWDLLKNQ